MVQEHEWAVGEKHILRLHWYSSITAEEIGKLCNSRSKNAVVAQAGRMKLGPKPRGRQKSFGTISRPNAPALAETMASDVVGVTLLDLENGMCHWPINHPGGLFFCGCKTHGKYCLEHAELAFQPKRRAA
jgi:hypothetical protein